MDISAASHHGIETSNKIKQIWKCIDDYRSYTNPLANYKAIYLSYYFSVYQTPWMSNLQGKHILIYFCLIYVHNQA